jgi:hypothetical protein
MFRAVFWVVLPCKMIVDWRFRGTYCLHHQGWVSRATEGSRFYRCRVTRWSVVVGDDRLGTGQWQWAGGGSRREREVYRQRMWSGCSEALSRASLKIGMASMLSGSGDGLVGGLSCPEKDRCTNYSCAGASILLLLGLLIPDDGGSTHLWNVSRQSFYTAVQPRRQLWTSRLSTLPPCIKKVCILTACWLISYELSCKFYSRQERPVKCKYMVPLCLFGNCHLSRLGWNWGDGTGAEFAFNLTLSNCLQWSTCYCLCHWTEGVRPRMMDF